MDFMPDYSSFFKAPTYSPSPTRTITPDIYNTTSSSISGRSLDQPDRGFETMDVDMAQPYTHDAPSHLPQPFPQSDHAPPSLTSAGKSRKRTTHDEESPSPNTKARFYNPTTLLNPKASAKRAQQDPEFKDIQSNNHEDPAHGISTSNGVQFGSLIEKMHGVTKREAAPMKRQKTHHDDDDDGHKKRTTFTGGGKGGVISEYIKEKRNEGQDEAGPPSSVVDLTADDDEVTIVKSTGPDMSREICLGTVHAKIHAHRMPAASKMAEDIMKKKWPVQKVYVRRSLEHQMMIGVYDRQENHFGNLDPQISSAIAPLLGAVSLHKLRCSAMLDERERKPDQRPGQSISEIFMLHITLFCTAKYGEGIGRHLSQRQAFLYPPINPDGRDYVNPHVPKSNAPARPKVMIGSATSSSQPVYYSSRTVEEVRNDVLDMFDKITNVEELPQMEGDDSLLATPLMEHQKQALYFLTQRETPTAPGDEPMSTLWKSRYRNDGSKVYYNVISGDEVKKVEDNLGGIFADMMGLGKTLSVLSRMAATLSEARAFGDEDLPREFDDHPSVERNTGATLIVCPKSVLSNWDEQIRAHLKKNKFKVYSYHGPKREQDVDVLAQYDIVITSYTTVATEFSFSASKYKALGKLNWFRIVLDEAHMIRNQATSTFAATCALASKRRWAVTGTPVQNRLDDLGALIKFLKLRPFHEKGSFEKHFLSPFKTGDTEVLNNLKLLVDSVTLRRSKDKIDLKPKVEAIERLDFTDEERRLYDAFAKDSNRKMNAILGSSGLRGKGTAHMLTFITRLRLICAHGRELLSEEDMKLLSGSSIDNAIDLGEEGDEKPTLTDAQVYNMYYMQTESAMNVCVKCATVIGEDDEDEDEDSEDETDVLAYMTQCFHLICPNCIGAFKKDLEKTITSDKYASCPTCEQHIKVAFSEITRGGVDAESERRNELRKNPTKAKNKGNYSGPHTKVRALMQRLEQNRRESDLLFDEPPIRSVVFSGWTQYLDLIEIALKDADIGYLRLDGKMSVSARTKVLEQFKTDDLVSVILVSIKAGGQGLNFTAANKVYMMEPQFNPGVEMQAVDRVHRLGQTRDVEIIKYIMTDSFEERILKLQNQKMRLAQTAFASGKKLPKAEEAKKRLEDLRSLFR